MNALACPWCGARELREFRFLKTLADAGALAPYAAVYERRGNPQESREHWQHLGGCRAWLFVRRNPSTGDVLEVRLLGGEAP